MELSEEEMITQIKSLIRDRESFIKGNLENNEDSEFVKDKKALEEVLNLIEKQQKEIEEKTTIIMAGAEKVKRLESQVEELLNALNKEEKINYIKPIDIKPQYYISEDTINEKIKELEEQKEKMKYAGNVCFADYEQFCKNLKFFKEQIEELLEEN